MNNLNPCQYHACNAFIERHEGEADYEYNRRKTHSPECANAMRQEGKLIKKGLQPMPLAAWDVYDQFNFRGEG